MEPSKTYNPSACCGDDCWIFNIDDDKYGPCWGDVEVICEEGGGDDYYWVHGCQGHKDMYEEWWGNWGPVENVLKFYKEEQE